MSSRKKIIVFFLASFFLVIILPLLVSECVYVCAFVNTRVCVYILHIFSFAWCVLFFYCFLFIWFLLKGKNNQKKTELYFYFIKKPFIKIVLFDIINYLNLLWHLHIFMLIFLRFLFCCNYNKIITGIFFCYFQITGSRAFCKQINCLISQYFK